MYSCYLLASNTIKLSCLSGYHLFRMSSDRLLIRAGPLERLFGGECSSAPVLDFLMLAAQKDQPYSESEIARYSGVSLKKTKNVISRLQGMSLVIEAAVDDDSRTKTSKKRKCKYMLNRNSAIMAPLEKLVISLTDTEIHKFTALEQMAFHDAHTRHGVGEAATELFEKGLVKLEDSNNNHQQLK